MLALPRAIGSSSSSAVLLELIFGGRAPRALLLGEADAILALGVVVAREMGYGSIPVLEVELARLPGAEAVRVAHGAITALRA